MIPSDERGNPRHWGDSQLRRDDRAVDSLPLLVHPFLLSRTTNVALGSNAGAHAISRCGEQAQFNNAPTIRTAGTHREYELGQADPLAAETLLRPRSKT
jgi:hypothetical protein